MSTDDPTPGSGTDGQLPAGPAHLPPARRRWVVVAAALTLAVDQATKWWVRSTLDLYERRSFLPGLDLYRVNNDGASFSLGSGRGPVVGVLALVIVVTLGWISRRVATVPAALATGAVLGGALGNLGDRLFLGDGGFLSGKVVDFLSTGWWPVFNVADSCIVVGGLFLSVLLWLRPSAFASGGPSSNRSQEVAPGPFGGAGVGEGDDGDSGRNRVGPDGTLR